VPCGLCPLRVAARRIVTEQTTLLFRDALQDVDNGNGEQCGGSGVVANVAIMSAFV